MHETTTITVMPALATANTLLLVQDRIEELEKYHVEHPELPRQDDVLETYLVARASLNAASPEWARQPHHTDADWEAIHADRDRCDHCGAPATLHFLSRGYSEDLAQLKDWEHHTDSCDRCNVASTSKHRTLTEIFYEGAEAGEARAKSA